MKDSTLRPLILHVLTQWARRKYLCLVVECMRLAIESFCFEQLNVQGDTLPYYGQNKHLCPIPKVNLGENSKILRVSLLPGVLSSKY